MPRFHLLLLVLSAMLMATYASDTDAEVQEGDVSLLDLMERSRRPGCSNRKCLRWYRGWWSAEPCGMESRQVAICNQKEKMYCCAHGCEAKGICPSGTCTSRKSDCEFGIVKDGCRGRQCYCCIPPPPPPARELPQQSPITE
ncbi:uncharacterized protein [Palaemon carinicauda]|uniref:uncharacterized protein n=1 Tax=Palaemon carinicauda TaxID=392227 RepID=UPI0035B59EAD